MNRDEKISIILNLVYEWEQAEENANNAQSTCEELFESETFFTARTDKSNPILDNAYAYRDKAIAKQREVEDKILALLK